MDLKKRGPGLILFILLALVIAAGPALIPVLAQVPPTVSGFAKTGLKNETVPITAADFSAYFSDADGQSLQKIWITQLPDAAAGTLKIGETVATTNADITVDELASFIFIPATAWTGTASFKWKGSDGTEYSTADASVNLTIVEPPVVNRPPVAYDLSIITEKNAPVANILPASDLEGHPLAFEVVDRPQKGTVVVTDAASGSFTYTPDTDVAGTDSFKFKANDGTSDSNIANVTITINVPVPPAFLYQDLVDHWANYSAGKLADRGIIMGEKINGKYYFYPDKIMSRAEFNLFLNAALEIDSDALGAEPVGYADENSIPGWVLHEARAAKREKLINGSLIGNKLYYRPNDTLNRLETMVILHNALKPTANNNDPLQYADTASIPKWAVQYVKNMRGYGIMKGYPDNTLHPFDTISRAQAAELLYQLIKYIEANA